MLVGNKSDLNDSRQVKLEEATQWAQNNQIGFYETSALDSNNIEHAFQTLAEQIYQALQKVQQIQTQKSEEKVGSNTSKT